MASFSDSSSNHAVAVAVAKSAFEEVLLDCDCCLLPILTFSPFAVWMVAPVAMPTLSGLVAKLKVNLLQGIALACTLVPSTCQCLQDANAMFKRARLHIDTCLWRFSTGDKSILQLGKLLEL